MVLLDGLCLGLFSMELSDGFYLGSFLSGWVWDYF